MNKRALALLLLIVLCSCTCGRIRRPPAVPSGIAAAFLDVGQADAAILRTAEGETVLFDTGDGAETVALLRREGVTRIDLLVVSHPHADHIGGMGAVLRAFPVRETWYAGEWRGRAARTLAEANPHRVAAGETRRLGKLELTVLHPPADSRWRGRRGKPDPNNASLVVKATYGDSRYLFTGDCELECWERMFKDRRAELRAEVLKVAHHGSWNATNAGVVGSVRPQTAVISCGRGNPYGHPHRTVLRLFEKARVEVFRTDRDGTVRCAGVQCRSGD
jgi:competence protein ComEC